MSHSHDSYAFASIKVLRHFLRASLVQWCNSMKVARIRCSRVCPLCIHSVSHAQCVRLILDWYELIVSIILVHTVSHPRCGCHLSVHLLLLLLLFLVTLPNGLLLNWQFLFDSEDLLPSIASPCLPQLYSTSRCDNYIRERVCANV